MKITITNKQSFDNLPSASGIESFNDKLYVIGDDSPFLYVLDFDFNILEKIELFKSKDFESGRIPKKVKVDLESITKLKIDNENYLLTVGSGSNQNREKGYLYNLSNSEIKEISLKPVFDLIKDYDLENKVINIEGLASNDKNIYFFDRESNAIFTFELNQFILYLQGKMSLSKPKRESFDLTGINNIRAGFSGSDIFENKLFFTASVEDTPDAISDGQVFGSFIGYIDFNDLGERKIKEYSQIKENDLDYLGKVEAITIYKKISENRFVGFLTTDDDLGGSELLKVEIEK